LPILFDRLSNIQLLGRIVKLFLNLFFLSTKLKDHFKSGIKYNSFEPLRQSLFFVFSATALQARQKSKKSEVSKTLQHKNS